MTNKEFKGFVRLSSDQYAELKLNGSLVIEGRTIEYSPLDTIYMITDAGNMIDVANTTEGEPNDVVLNITNNILRAQLNQTIKTKINNKQDKLTAGTNITIDTNNVISASGGLTKVAATDVDSESATNGQVLTANGSGGASWQNASGGDKLYRHIIWLYSINAYLTFINRDSTSLSNIQLLSQTLYNSGADSTLNNFMSVSGLKTDTNNVIIGIAGVSAGSRISVKSVILNISDGVLTSTVSTQGYSSLTIYDTVTEL